MIHLLAILIWAASLYLAYRFGALYHAVLPITVYIARPDLTPAEAAPPPDDVPTCNAGGTCVPRDCNGSIFHLDH